MLQRLHSSARYYLFILTVWEEEPSAQGIARWRYSLEQSQTGERRGFKNLEELMAYLALWTQQPPRVDEFGEPDSGE